MRDFVRTEVVPLEERIDVGDEAPERIITACKAMGLYGSRSGRSTATSA